MRSLLKTQSIGSNNIPKIFVPSNKKVKVKTTCLRFFIGTWNVGGKAPDPDFELSEWIGACREDLP